MLVEQEMSQGLGKRARPESWLLYHVESSKGWKTNHAISTESHEV